MPSESEIEAEAEPHPHPQPALKTIYGGLVQPSPLVLFSSLPISSPFQHASLSIDKDLTADSFIALLDDCTSQPVEIPSSSDIHYPIRALYRAKTTTLDTEHAYPFKPLGHQHQPLAPIRSVVLHLQSPNTKSTFLRLPPAHHHHTELGIELGFIHLQLKPLGHNFMFEIGLKDDSGTLLRLRCSTFQSDAREYPATEKRSALLHLPLVFPPISAHSQTDWVEVMVPLSRIWTKYRSTAFVCVHASVRLRRIYFSDGGQVRFGKAHDWYDSRKGRLVVGGQNQDTPDRPELVLFLGALGG